MKFHELNAEPRVSVEPVLEPVSAEEFRDSVRFSATELDQTIDQKLAAARRQLEIDTSRAVMTQTLVLRLDCFPCDGIELRRCPVQSVTSITYLDSAGVSQTLATTVYTVDIYSNPARITLKYGQSWPATLAQANAVTVTFVAGYGSVVESVPAEVKEAIIAGAAMGFETVEEFELYERAYKSKARYLDWAGYR